MFKQTLGALGGATILVLGGCSGNPTGPDWGDSDSLRPFGAPVTANHPNGEVACYFPLGEGDVWIYEVTEASVGPDSPNAQVMSPPPPPPTPPEEVALAPRRFTVRSSASTGGAATVLENYLFPFSENDAVFRNDDGVAYELTNSAMGAWYPWCDFGAGAAEIAIPEFADDCFHGSIGRCMGTSRVAVPAGEFDHAATIDYETRPCADSGVVREVLAPNVGLIERTVVSLEGQVTWSLVYARVGNREWGGIDAPPRETTDGVE